MIALAASLPPALQAIAEWMSRGPVLAGMGVCSLALIVASLIGIPWFLARLPADYLTRESAAEERYRREGWPLRIAKNLLGVVLIVCGLVMLVLPGQGLLTLIVGLMLLEFPGKAKLERKLLSRPKIFQVVNKLRARAHKPPLESP